ncbi:hypothetical protein FI667_g7000, partial [Globisporangium splendens]
MGLCASREIRKADQRFEKTSTFVHYAMVGDLSNMKLMLAKEEMDPNAQDKDQDDVVRFLLQDVKMDINSTSENKETPLHKAVTVTDVVPGQISTARVNEELEEWRQKVQTEVQPKSKARTGSFQNSMMGKVSRRRSTGPIENTLITKFGASIQDFSDCRSSDYSFSSARSGMWVRVAATDAGGNSMNSSGTATPSAANSVRGNDVSPSPVTPLDLAAASVFMDSPTTRTSSMSSISSTAVSEQDGGHTGITRQKKNLRYAGKRVIMTLRVKQKMPVDEKQEMIRLLLLKYMQPNGTACGDDDVGSSVLDQDQGCTKPPGSVEKDSMPKPRPPLHHCISGLTLSLPPDS